MRVAQRISDLEDEMHHLESVISYGAFSYGIRPNALNQAESVACPSVEKTIFKLAEDNDMRKQKQCFDNAFGFVTNLQRQATDRTGYERFDYVLGLYVLPEIGLPIEHAWVEGVTEDGRRKVFDITLDRMTADSPSCYFRVATWNENSLIRYVLSDEHGHYPPDFHGLIQDKAYDKLVSRDTVMTAREKLKKTTDTYKQLVMA